MVVVVPHLLDSTGARGKPPCPPRKTTPAMRFVQPTASRVGYRKRQRVARLLNSSYRSTMPNARSGFISNIAFERRNSAVTPSPSYFVR